MSIWKEKRKWLFYAGVHDPTYVSLHSDHGRKLLKLIVMDIENKSVGIFMLIWQWICTCIWFFEMY